MHFVNAKSILSAKNGMNIYRGCTHGCIYCDSRSDCYQMKHFHSECERHGVMHNNDEIFKYLFTFPQNFTQLSLF